MTTDKGLVLIGIIYAWGHTAVHRLHPGSKYSYLVRHCILHTQSLHNNARVEAFPIMFLLMDSHIMHVHSERHGRSVGVTRIVNMAVCMRLARDKIDVEQCDLGPLEPH